MPISSCSTLLVIRELLSALTTIRLRSSLKRERKNMRRNRKLKWLATLLTSWLFSCSPITSAVRSCRLRLPSTMPRSRVRKKAYSTICNRPCSNSSTIANGLIFSFRKNERIICNFNITVTKYDRDQNLFTCKALIQANRPVFNSAYTSTLYNNVDDNFTFQFC